METQNQKLFDDLIGSKNVLRTIIRFRNGSQIFDDDLYNELNVERCEIAKIGKILFNRPERAMAGSGPSPWR